MSRSGSTRTWQFIDRYGRVQLSLDCERASNFFRGLASVRRSGGEGCIGRTGRFVIEPKFEWIGTFTSELAPAVRRSLGEQPTESGHGFVDQRGEWQIRPVFEYAEEFFEERARVKLDGKFGYIDMKGIWAIPPTFIRAESFSGGLALVATEEGDAYVDLTGSFAIRPGLYYAYSGFHDGVALARPGSGPSDTRYGYIGPTGQWIVKPRFESAAHFSEGLATVREEVDKGWGFIDPTGSFVIEPILEGACSFSEGLALVKYRGYWGYIDTHGEFVITPRFRDEETTPFHEGRAAFKKFDNEGDFLTFGFIDRNGEVVIEPRFDQGCTWFQEDLAAVRLCQ